MIRKARVFDTPKILPLVREFYKETSYANRYAFDVETVTELTQKLITNGIVFVATDGDAIVGVIGISIHPFLFNKHSMSSGEIIWRVDPAYQSKGFGKSLLLAADEACEKAGVKTNQLFLMADSPPIARALYEHIGYRLTELVFTKEY